MLTIGVVKGSGAGYYSKYLDEEKEKSAEKGQWRGSKEAGLALGIDVEQAVTKEDLTAVFQGYNATTGEALVKNAGAEDKLAAMDLSYSVPKSVSILREAMTDEDKAKLDKIIDEANTAFIDKGREMIHSRSGAGGVNKLQAEIVVATFQHYEARSTDGETPDMHLHRHNCFVNVGLCEDGETRSVNMKGLYDNQHVLSYTADSVLAEKLQEMGYSVRTTEFAKGKKSFEVAGIKEETIKSFSKRGLQVTEATEQAKLELEEAGYSTSNKHNVADKANRDSKRNKIDMTYEEMAADWKKDLDTNHGINSETIEQLKDLDNEHSLEPLKSPEKLLRGLTDNEVAFKEKDLAQAVYNDCFLQCNEEEIKARILEAKEQAIELDNGLYTTQDLYDIEQNVIKSSSTKTKVVVSNKSIEKAIEQKECAEEQAIKSKTGKDITISFSNEQVKAVKHILGDKNQILLLQGKAGTGKTFALDAARIGLENDGFKVIGCAPSGKAAKGLETEAKIESNTIHKLIIDIDNGKTKLDDKTAIVVDEAGMVDSRLMGELHSKLNGAKLILVGDSKQLQPVWIFDITKPRQDDIVRLSRRSSDLGAVAFD